MSDTTESTNQGAELESAIDNATDAVRVQSQQLDELSDQSPAGALGMAHLMDVPVQITVEIGRRRIRLSELCKLGPGSLLELDREAHEPADVLVNGKVVARGEVVTLGESYALRITEVEANGKAA
ncbi:MAG: flagellar motor switch protein FliN [Planctomycetota bacterium]|jgi:flagellar motor switch protein FliN/FliY